MFRRKHILTCERAKKYGALYSVPPYIPSSPSFYQLLHTKSQIMIIWGFSSLTSQLSLGNYLYWKCVGGIFFDVQFVILWCREKGGATPYVLHLYRGVYRLLYFLQYPELKTKHEFKVETTTPTPFTLLEGF